MEGNFTYVESTGVHDQALRLRSSSVTMGIKNNIGNYPIPGLNNRPNNELDKIGTNNIQWTIKGTVPVVSGVVYNEGLGLLAQGNESTVEEISYSGLLTLSLTGSNIWFYDEIMTTKARIVNGELLVTSSGTWVEVDSFNAGRATDYIAQDCEVGYVIPYTLVLTETKGTGE